jgi:hypothetical protein
MKFLKSKGAKLIALNSVMLLAVICSVQWPPVGW